MNREHKIFLGWGTVFLKGTSIFEGTKEGKLDWEVINWEYKNLFGVCVLGGGGGGERRTKTVNDVPFLITQPALKVPLKSP